MELEEKKIEALEKALTVVKYISVALLILLVCCSSWLAKTVFAYQEAETITVKERYSYTVGTVNTYVCYTTEYGDCYHAKGCGSLWNSQYKTTVYQAKERGYSACSKCTPKERTTYDIVETGYKDVQKTEYITKEPTFAVWAIGTVIVLVFNFLAIYIIRYKIDDLQIKINTYNSLHLQEKTAASEKPADTPTSEKVENTPPKKIVLKATNHYIWIHY